MADNEERLLEEQLEVQLHEQKDSLAALKEALASDPDNSELLAVQEELVQAIKDMEEGLLHLKRARLVQEADMALNNSLCTSKDFKVELLDPRDVEPESLEDHSYSVGSKCRFRYTDGRWYNGLIVGMDGPDVAKISFLTPTSESMLICKFFLQQRCRFGSNCRLSHGVNVPLSSLKKYIPITWDQSLVGSSIWAVLDDKAGIWREAELESWDSSLGVGHVVFRHDGSAADIGTTAISFSEYAQMSDEEESDTSWEQSDDSSEYEENGSEGVGFLESTKMQSGVQTGTAIFAKWENHTRGIASKMMANMGYREGMGLGVSGQGMLDPITVRVLPAKQSLDHALKSQEIEQKKENHGKKRSRGGQRKRDKKFAAAARAAKEEERQQDVFNLINTQLVMHGETMNGVSAKKQNIIRVERNKEEARRDIIAFDDEVKELKSRVAKLEEMVNRNRKEKLVYDAAMRKLNETRKSLAEAEAAHASASDAVASKDREKRWLKF